MEKESVYYLCCIGHGKYGETPGLKTERLCFKSCIVRGRFENGRTVPHDPIQFRSIPFLPCKLHICFVCAGLMCKDPICQSS